MDWTDDAIAQLKKLWAEGLSTAKIGGIMGISKNAVVGKAHRLQLPSRPSPIKTSAGGIPSGRAVAPKRPAAPKPTIVAVPATPVAPVQAPVAVKPVAPIAPRPQPVRVVTASRPRQGSSCCWPLGEPGTAQFRFCDATAVQGRPYCAEHVQVAYVRIRDRREDVA